MRVFTWGVAGQMAANHWLIGVGADNFGIAFNAAKADLAAKHPSAASEEIAEDYVVERAHNEFLQIFAELGIVAILLFMAVFGYFALLTVKCFRRNIYALSPVLWAAHAGMTAFFSSSMFSSFSFRAFQNGLVFFIVFAVALNELAKTSPNKVKEMENIRQPLTRKPAFALAVIFAGLTAIYSATKAVAAYEVYRGLI